MAVPYTFATATGSIPLSQLDSNFATGVTIGNTSVQLGGTITTINNLSLANVAITSVNTQFPNGYLANSNVVLGTTTLTLGSTVTSVDGVTLSNVTISSGNVTISNVSVSNFSATTANVSGTANISNLVVIGNATVGGNVSVTGNVTGAKGTFTSANVSGTANVQIIAVTQDATVAGNTTVTGNVGIGSAIVASKGTLQVGTIGYTDTGIVAGFASNVAGYNQLILQNISTNAAASTNFNISNDAGTATTNFGEFGINSSTFTGTGAFSQPGYVYLAAASTDLAIGTYASKSIHFVVNSGATDAVTIDTAGSLNLLGAYTEGVVAIGNSSTSKTISLAAGTFQTVTMTGNCTFTMPTATAGKSFILIVSTGAGSFTGTFTSVKWPSNTAPTLTTTASRWDILSFFSDGTNWYGNYVQAFQ
jgi:hypothetical protein